MGRNSFQKTEKAGNVVYTAPELFTAYSGVKQLEESGIFSSEGKAYHKAYFCSENKNAVTTFEKIKGCMMLLRGADISFTFYEILTRREEKVILLLRMEAESLEEAKESFGILETDLQGNLFTFGIVLEPLTMEKRLELIHNMVMVDFPDARMDVTDYLRKPGNWLPDFDMKRYTEGKRHLKTKEGYLSVMNVRKVASEHAAAVYRLLKEYPACQMLVTAYEPVEDNEVVAFLRKEYFGTEHLFQRLKRRNSGMGLLLQKPEQNERRYLFSSIVFVLKAEEEERLNTYKRELATELEELGCEVGMYVKRQKEVYQKLLTMQAEGQFRLVQVQNAVKMNPFYRAEQAAEVADESMDSKAALLAAFDRMTERNG